MAELCSEERGTGKKEKGKRKNGRKAEFRKQKSEVKTWCPNPNLSSRLEPAGRNGEISSVDGKMEKGKGKKAEERQNRTRIYTDGTDYHG